MMGLGPGSHGKPLNDFKQGNYMSGFYFYKDHSDCSEKNVLESSKTGFWETYLAKNKMDANRGS